MLSAATWMNLVQNYCTKWRKPDRGRQLSYDIAYMWKQTKKESNELIYKTERLRDIENKGERWKRDKLGGWD